MVLLTHILGGDMGGILCQNCSDSLLILLLRLPPPHQIENASDVLITPLEKFRKEQIGAAKVRNFQFFFLDFRAGGLEKHTFFRKSWADKPGT